MPRPRAVVTGGAGFLGSHLCERLLLDGWSVLCLDDPGSAALADAAARALTYGTDPAADLRVTDVAPAGIGVRFRLHHHGEAVEVTVPAAP